MKGHSRGARSRRHLRKTRLAVAIACLHAMAALADPAASPDPDYNPFRDLGLQAPGEESETAGEPYRDRIIAPDALQPLVEESDSSASLGAPRAAHVEMIASRSRISGESTNEFGLAFGAMRETNGLGTLSAEGLLFRSDRARDGDAGWRGRATLWQRGLAMPGGWTVNNGLGALNTTLPGLLRDQYRFFLPSVPLLGLNTEWQQRERGLEWQAAVGQGGSFNGGVLNGFEAGDGLALSGGAGWRWSPAWTGAVSLLSTDGDILPLNPGLPSADRGRTTAAVFGARWTGPRDQVSLQLQASDAVDGSAAGAWMDARSQRGRATHRAGVFNLGDDLAWGIWPINNDVRGAYYRIDYNRARWSWNGGLDRIASISGNGFDGWYGTGALRYQYSASLSYGGSVSARDDVGGAANASARAFQLFTDLRSRAGQTRVQYDHATADATADSWELTLDHALRTREGTRVSLAAGYGERGVGPVAVSPLLTLAAYGGLSLGDTVTLDGSARWTRIRGDDAGSGLDLSVGLRWRIARQWSLTGQWYENRGPQRSPFVLDPLTNQLVQLNLPTDRTVYVSLRYEFSDGRPQQVLGGAPGTAFGSVEGSVFLDENGDGVRSASELPARNVTVTLDGGFVVRTDDEGRFRFDRVAVGEHQVVVVSDNLPLPWSFEGGNSDNTVRVQVRTAARLDIGARRPR